MILLWFKIVFYKITRRNRAEAGTEPHTGARATDPNHWSSHTDAPGTFCPDAETISPETFGVVGFTREPGAPDHTIKTERLRRLIELGLVSEPDGLGDMIRIEQWHEDWARREAGDPSACPCGGRHYPEADACRWCRCHDPRNKHHAAPSVGIMQVIKPEFPWLGTTIECTVCGHAPHGADTCSSLTDDGAERCGCGGILNEARRDCPLTVDGSGCQGPAGCGPGRCAAQEILDAYENRDPVTESSVRPPAEIVCCEACGHPQHAMGNGRCAFLVPLRAGYEDAVPDFCGCAVTPEEDEA